LEQTAQNS